VKMADAHAQGTVHVAAVWNRAAEGDADVMQAGQFRVDLAPASRRQESHRGVATGAGQ